MAFGKKVMQLDWIAREATQAGVEMLVLPPCEWSSHRERNEEVFTEWVKEISGDAGRDWFSGGEAPKDDIELGLKPS